MKRTLCLLALSGSLASGAAAAAIVSTFDDLTLAPESYYSPAASTPFTSGAATFTHTYTAAFGTWDGWIYSNTTDTTTPGFSNQSSAYAGSGATGSANYGVFFFPFTESPTVTFAIPSLVSSALLTNTTYTALSMLNGDTFSKKFGGASGDDPDYFMLTIVGKDASGLTTGTVDFYLADYRFSDNDLDYIVQDWSPVDLSTLGVVSSLSFAFDSSDVGPFGINTPLYFALDNLSVTPVPEPASAVALLVGLAAVLGYAHRRRRR